MNPDAYYGTRVRVNKSRMVRKIYAVFYLKYISNPFSVKIWCKTGFRKPQRVLRYASSGEQKPYCAQDLRCILLFYISYPFSVKIWCKTGFPSPDAYYDTQVRVRKIRMVRKIYAVFYLKYISNPFSVKIWCKTGFPSPDAYVYTQVRVRKIRMAPKIYAKPSFFAISAVFNSSNLDTPFSCMVTPYSTSASSMVPRRWVIKMNWVFLVIRRTY